MANVLYISDLVLDEEQIDVLEKSIGEEIEFTHLKKDEWNMVSPDISKGEIAVFNYDTPPDEAKNAVTTHGEKGGRLFYPETLRCSDRKVYDDDPEWLVTKWEEVPYEPVDLGEFA
jgi:hypothetical protein